MTYLSEGQSTDFLWVRSPVECKCNPKLIVFFVGENVRGGRVLLVQNYFFK